MSRYRVSGAVASEVLDGEAIVIDLDSGAYFSFRGWSTWAWEALAAGIDTDELAAEFGDVGGSAEFVDALVAAGLITDRADQPVADLPDRPSAPAEPLAFDRFDDMADMIQVDPVHEVELETGWPRPADG